MYLTYICSNARMHCVRRLQQIRVLARKCVRCVMRFLKGCGMDQALVCFEAEMPCSDRHSLNGLPTSRLQ